MRLFQRPGSKNWQYEIKGLTGKIRKSTGTTLKREARRIAEYHQQKTYNQIYFGAKTTVTLSEAINLFLNEQQTNSRQTYEQYKHMSNVLIKLLGASKPLEQINSLDISKIQSGASYAPKTINHIIGTLNSIRIRATEWNVEPPVFKYKRLKVSSKIRYISHEEEKLIFNNLTNQDQKDICIVLLDTGLRISECVSLIDKDVDLATNAITIYRSKTNNAGLIGITNRMRPVIERRLQLASSYLFPNPKDLRVPRTTTTKSIRRAIKAAGLNSPENVSRYGTCTVHSFRDTFATRLVKAGVSLYKVQVMLGHSSPTMTQKYAHLETGDICQEISKVLNDQIL